MAEADLKFLGDRLRGHYREVIVDAFVWNQGGNRGDNRSADSESATGDNRLYMQKRSPTRKLFPNFWDPVGGHLEPNESLSECLRREMLEESGLKLDSIVALVHQFEWDTDRTVINLQFVCTASGEPTLEAGKVLEVRWLREEELAELGDSLTEPMRQGLMKAFEFIRKQWS